MSPSSPRDRSICVAIVGRLYCVSVILNVSTFFYCRLRARTPCFPLPCARAAALTFPSHPPPGSRALITHATVLTPSPWRFPAVICNSRARCSTMLCIFLMRVWGACGHRLERRARPRACPSRSRHLQAVRRERLIAGGARCCAAPRAGSWTLCSSSRSSAARTSFGTAPHGRPLRRPARAAARRGARARARALRRCRRSAWRTRAQARARARARARRTKRPVPTAVLVDTMRRVPRHFARLAPLADHARICLNDSWTQRGTTITACSTRTRRGAGTTRRRSRRRRRRRPTAARRRSYRPGPPRANAAWARGSGRRAGGGGPRGDLPTVLSAAVSAAATLSAHSMARPWASRAARRRRATGARAATRFSLRRHDDECARFINIQ